MSANLLGLLTLVLGVPLCLIWVLVLGWLVVETPRNLVLRVQFISAVSVLVFALVFGPIFVNNDTIPPWLDLATTKMITRWTALLLVTVAPLVWLWIYRRSVLRLLAAFLNRLRGR